MTQEEEILKLREQLRKSRERSRSYYTYLHDLRKCQRLYDETKEMSAYVTKTHYEQYVDEIIKRVDEQIARVEGKT